MSRSVKFVFARHLPKPAGAKGDATDSICPERGPLRLAQVRKVLTDVLGITAPTLVAHSEWRRTNMLAGLLYPDAPKLMLPGLGYAWLEPMYGDVLEGWAAMEARLGKPVIEATAQGVYEAWPEAASIVPNMIAVMSGLHFKACQMVPDESETPIVIVIGHTGLLELGFEDENERRDLHMLGEGGIITFSGAINPGYDFNEDVPDQFAPELLYPDIEPEAIEIPAGAEA